MKLEQLQARLLELEAENRFLRERLQFLEYHPTIAAGLRGETLVSQAVNGTLTVFTASSDVVISDSGLRLEVKYSKLNQAVAKIGASTQRWTWSRPLGQNNSKVYDRLILVGVADIRYRTQYCDPESPFVIFDVPFAEVAPLARKSGTHWNIQISTNPLRSSTAPAQALFKQYQVSPAELTRRYGNIAAALPGRD